MSSVFKNENENFCVALMYDLIFLILEWISNVLIAFAKSFPGTNFNCKQYIELKLQGKGVHPL